MTDIPDEAVEAAARVDYLRQFERSGVTARWETNAEDVKAYHRRRVLPILTAAAPIIAAQATADPDHWAHAAIAAQDAALTARINEAVKWGREKDAELSRLRAGIEALRDEWQSGMDERCGCATCAVTRRCATALDALIGGAK